MGKTVTVLHICLVCILDQACLCQMRPGAMSSAA